MHRASRYAARLLPRSIAGLAACVLVALGSAGAAGADEFTGPLTLPMPAPGQVSLIGPATTWAGLTRSEAGWSADGAGDVNGDGHADVIVGAPDSGVAGARSGTAYVVFGPLRGGDVDLAALGSGGFRIDGASGYVPELNIDASSAGVSVSGAGDVNGDGLDDVVVAAPGWAQNPGMPPGSAFVVFGKTSTDSVDLAAIGSSGFQISGQADNKDGPYEVENAGDVNGDGLDDVAMVARHGGPAHVVFGKANTATVHLDLLGSDGVSISPSTGWEWQHVAGVGDVNGDGVDDVAASFANKTYVVFGKPMLQNVNASALGAGGFVVANSATYVTAPVLGAGGDVNGDGYDDVLIGDPWATFNGSSAGTVWVVFGKTSTTTVDARALGKNGFRIDGIGKERVGESIGTAGDVNGDGRDDILAGGYASYLVLGKTSTTNVNLSQLGGQGFRMAWRMDRESMIAGPGDLIGNARPDILLSAIGRTTIVEAPAIFHLSTTSGPPTSVLQLSGSFFDPGEPIDIFLDGVLQKRVTADAAGNFANVRATVPGTALPGTHRLRAHGATSGRSVERPFLVRTNWAHQGYGATRTAFNPYENVLGRSTVAGLRPAWTGALTGPFAGAPIVAAGNVHVASRAGVVSTLDPATGAVLWSTPTGAPIAAGPAAANSTVYVGGADGRLHALDKRFGRPRWVKQLSGGVFTTPAVSQSLVYVHSTDGYVHALDANTGAQRWRVHVGPNAGGSPAVANSGVYVVTGSDVVALALATGARIWTRSIAGAADLTTPAVASSVVYVGSGASPAVHALAASTGSVRWSRALPESSPTSPASLVVGEGVAYAQTATTLHALNAADGVPRFTRADAGATSAGDTFALANHVLYLPGPRALNASTGALLWSGGSDASSPSVADGVVYAGASAFRLP